MLDLSSLSTRTLRLDVRLEGSDFGSLVALEPPVAIFTVFYSVTTNNKVLQPKSARIATKLVQPEQKSDWPLTSEPLLKCHPIRGGRR